jgi:hypothetical protein
MSTYWDVACIDCDKDLGLHGNHQERSANAIAADAVRLASVPGLSVDAERTYDFFGEGSACFNTDFFAEHKGHRIRARSEYGDISNACGAWVNCPTCEHQGSCTLEAGHVGDHLPTRKPPANA